MASPEVRAKYHLASANPADYGFLKTESNLYTIEGTDDEQNYALTMACLRSLHFSEQEIDSIWQLVVAILHIGNVEYKVNLENEAVTIEESCHASVQRVAELL